MAKIIYQREVYQEVSLKMFHESEIQDALASRAHLIFPSYNYAQFDPLVTNASDSARPDFVLIECEYRRWYVGEVEMIRHDLIGHVLRQVRVFVSGEYGESHIRHIARNLPDLDQKRLQLLIETVPPTVLVVVDKMDETWRNAIHSEGAKMAVFEVFRREKSADLIFRVNGDAPDVLGEFLSYCAFDRSFPRLLKIQTPAGVPASNGQRLAIEYEGIQSDWIYMVAEDKAWLNPVGYTELPRNFQYILSYAPNGQLKLEAKHHASNRRP